MADDEAGRSGGPIPQHSRMNDEFLQERSDAFRRGTQRKGLPERFGTGKPGVMAEALRKIDKAEAAAAKRAAKR